MKKEAILFICIGILIFSIATSSNPGDSDLYDDDGIAIIPTVIINLVSQNISGNITADAIISRTDTWCNGTDCFSLSNFLASGSIGANTTAEIIAVTNNSAHWNASLLTGDWINATYNITTNDTFIGSLSCTNIIGGTDGNFCTDADSGAGSGNTTAEIIAVTNNSIHWNASLLSADFIRI